VRDEAERHPSIDCQLGSGQSAAGSLRTSQSKNLIWMPLRKMTFKKHAMQDAYAVHTAQVGLALTATEQKAAMTCYQSQID
jgi:hypothetical protein